MQKTVRINLLARNSAAKHFQKIKHRDTKTEWSQWHAATKRIKNTEGKYIREEKLNRRQDWIAGPLAPNRNSGTAKGQYGTSETDFFQGANIPESVRAGPKKEGFAAITEEEEAGNGFKGNTIVGNVVSNDRVVIVAGPERLRGLIGTVGDVDEAKETVKLININTADIKIPDYAQPPPSANDSSPAKFTSLDLPIPMSHIRLVGTITDDRGKSRDIIFRHIHAGPPYQQRSLGSHLPSHTRYITGGPGEPVFEIPWPPEHVSSDFVYHAGDTTRNAVQSSSWIPTLLAPPLGYQTEVPDRVDSTDDSYSRSQELLTIDVKGPDGLNNIQRAGLQGFVDIDKLIARQKRVAEGIMNEFRTKTKELNTRHDDTNWVKRKMIEDARSIWYQERKLVSPVSQAAELAVQKRLKERQAKIEEEKVKVSELKDLVRSLQTKEIESGRKAVQVTVKREKKIMKGLNLPLRRGVGFLPDRKLAKKLQNERKKIAASDV